MPHFSRLLFLKKVQRHIGIWYISAQSFITLFKLVWGEYDIVALNEWKKKCVDLQRTWVSKRTVCVCNKKKQSKSLETRYDTTYISDRYYWTCYWQYIRTHIYVFLFSVKKHVFELSWVWPWRWPRGGTPYMIFIGPVFHNTTKTCLKGVGHGGYEWVEKVMCRFAEEMS